MSQIKNGDPLPLTDLEPTEVELHWKSAPVGTHVASNVTPARRSLIGGQPRDHISSAEVTSNAGRMLLFTYILSVILPTVASFVYFMFVASPQYLVETKVIVRNARSSEQFSVSSGLLSKLGMSGSSGTEQDSLIISDYLKSRGVIEDIGGLPALQKYYGGQNIDSLSRLAPKASSEDAWNYWTDHNTAQVDTMANIVTIRVVAFTPQNAFDLSKSVIAKSEALINNLSLRGREDVLKLAQQEVERSAGDLAKIRAQILAFQEKTQALSPADTARQIGSILSSLTLRKLQIEGDLSAAKKIGLVDRPSDAQTRSQLTVINDEIKKYQSLLTGGNGAATVSTQIKDFELLKLQEEFINKIYTIGREGYETARQDLAKQQLYLAVIVPPMLPDYPSYPEPFKYTALLLISLTILWGIISLLIASIRDGMG